MIAVVTTTGCGVKKPVTKARNCQLVVPREAQHNVWVENLVIGQDGKPKMSKGSRVHLTFDRVEMKCEQP